MPLNGSVRHSELRLSFEALAASHLAVQHLGRCSPLRPTHSAVARRALVLYARSFERMTTPEREREAMHVLSASKGFTALDTEGMERALAGLEASGEGDALPSLAQVLHGPEKALPADALMEKVDAMLKAAHPRKFAHL